VNGISWRARNADLNDKVLTAFGRELSVMSEKSIGAQQFEKLSLAAEVDEIKAGIWFRYSELNLVYSEIQEMIKEFSITLPDEVKEWLNTSKTAPVLLLEDNSDANWQELRDILFSDETNAAFENIFTTVVTMSMAVDLHKTVDYMCKFIKDGALSTPFVSQRCATVLSRALATRPKPKLFRGNPLDFKYEIPYKILEQ